MSESDAEKIARLEAELERLKISEDDRQRRDLVNTKVYKLNKEELVQAALIVTQVPEPQLRSMKVERLRFMLRLLQGSGQVVESKLPDGFKKQRKEELQRLYAKVTGSEADSKWLRAELIIQLESWDVKQIEAEEELMDATPEGWIHRHPLCPDCKVPMLKKPGVKDGVMVQELKDECLMFPECRQSMPIEIEGVPAAFYLRVKSERKAEMKVETRPNVKREGGASGSTSSVLATEAGGAVRSGDSSLEAMDQDIVPTPGELRLIKEERERYARRK
jgi:hypothetical protein